MTSTIPPIIITTDDAIEAMRVDPSGKVGIGTPSPQKPLDVAASGGIQISQSDSASANNELYFQDNGQIRSLDDNHRIIFDRANNILELREFGDVVFSPGAGAGMRTQTVTFKSNGNVGIGATSPGNQLVNTAQASFGGNSPNTGSEPIEVQGPGAGVSFYDRAGGSTGRWVVYSNRSAGAGTETLRFWSASDKVTISQGGDLTFTGNLLGRYGDATKALHNWLYAQNSTTTIDISLSTRRPVFALITLPGVRLSQAQPFSALAYIDSVDGQSLGSPDPAHAAWSGEAQTIRFGVTTSPWMEAWALAIVFYV